MFERARVLAVDSFLLSGERAKSQCYVFDWPKSGLTVYWNRRIAKPFGTFVKIKDTEPGYGKRNAIAFLRYALQCVKSDERAEFYGELIDQAKDVIEFDLQLELRNRGSA